jgi:hypothetical protein
MEYPKRIKMAWHSPLFKHSGIQNNFKKDPSVFELLGNCSNCVEYHPFYYRTVTSIPTEIRSLVQIASLLRLVFEALPPPR